MIRLEIDHQHYSDVLKMVSSVAVGASSPLHLEEQARELQEFVPILPSMVSWMGVAIERTLDAKDGDITEDRGALQNFLIQNEMMCRSQGALAALLCVAEVLRSLSKEEAEGVDEN